MNDPDPAHPDGWSAAMMWSITAAGWFAATAYFLWACRRASKSAARREQSFQEFAALCAEVFRAWNAQRIPEAALAERMLEAASPELRDRIGRQGDIHRQAAAMWSRRGQPKGGL